MFSNLSCSILIITVISLKKYKMLQKYHQHKWCCQGDISFIPWRSVNRISTLQTNQTPLFVSEEQVQMYTALNSETLKVIDTCKYKYG